MKTPRFEGPFRWGKVRAQLLSLRDDAQSIRKISGRNVTIDKEQGKGSVVNAHRSRVVPSCPPSVTFTVSGVTVGCGCIPSGDFGFEFEALDMNGTYTADIDFSDDTVCAYFHSHVAAIRRWNFTDTECTTPAVPDHIDYAITWRFWRLSNVWYSEAQSSDGLWEFHGGPGTGTSTITISNVLTCGTWPQNICDDAVLYWWASSCFDFYPVAQGGTVVFTP